MSKTRAAFIFFPGVALVLLGAVLWVLVRLSTAALKLTSDALDRLTRPRTPVSHRLAAPAIQPSSPHRIGVASAWE